ncbi:hypothetical protein Purlil1_12089 [Purpureocillium lilacinum]|uniref:Uncharacterized protein n=1 Tax=Purpureocillium lilacinum TaxID=33203 RepID=A0ABR0BIE6_PURLI|nr:hypothetical protein Purlil1_12089 [Purpureocillium lilacinum]
MRSTFKTVTRATAHTFRSRYITTSSSLPSSPSASKSSGNADETSTGNGGRCSPETRSKPKVYNSDITGSGSDPTGQLTNDQQKEVDEHNRYFVKKRTIGKKEKVDDKYWKGNSKG